MDVAHLLSVLLANTEISIPNTDPPKPAAAAELTFLYQYLWIFSFFSTFLW